jgi:hypothetical protein
MLEYVETLTGRDAPRPRGSAEAEGGRFETARILQITLIASWFNYINRVADAHRRRPR